MPSDDSTSGSSEVPAPEGITMGFSPAPLTPTVWEVHFVALPCWPSHSVVASCFCACVACCDGIDLSMCMWVDINILDRLMIHDHMMAQL